ncbi:MAG: hypothetical protein JWM48_319, partial [Mycobacterium sp.]|nr:hypothetical protein [Mycobacterium sp.]
MAADPRPTARPQAAGPAPVLLRSVAVGVLLGVVVGVLASPGAGLATGLTVAVLLVAGSFAALVATRRRAAA